MDQMKSLLRMLSVIVAAGAVASCATGPEISAGHDRGPDFSGYRSFGFCQPPGTDPAGYGSNDDGPIVAMRIGMAYAKWRLDRAFLLVHAQQIVGRLLESFKEFPPSQKPGSFNLDHVMPSLSVGLQGS